MEFNTVTTIGDLKEGDRFTFPGKTEVWQITGRFKNQVSYNAINEISQRRQFRFDKVTKASTSVRFLRHTTKQEVE